jgi:hypothetical protein
MNRKRLLLAALVGLLALSLAYAFWAMPRQETAPSRAAGQRAAAKPKGTGKAGPPPADRLHLGLLAQAPQPFPGADRDIFRFRGGRTPLIEVPVEMAPPVTVAPPPPPPPTPEEILRQKVAGFTFLGFLDKGGVKTVFLSSGGELFLVKAGEGFGKNRDLLAQEITARELVVRAAGGSETVRVQLVESEALKPVLMGPGATGPGVAPRGAPTTFRQSGASIPPRRSILPQRAASRPPQPAEEDGEQVEQDVQPPDDGVKQEELLKQGLPGGDGNGTTQ